MKGTKRLFKIFQNVGEKKIGIKRDKQNILRQNKQIPPWKYEKKVRYVLINENKKMKTHTDTKYPMKSILTKIVVKSKVKQHIFLIKKCISFLILVTISINKRTLYFLSQCKQYPCYNSKPFFDNFVFSVFAFSSSEKRKVNCVEDDEVK